MSLSDDQPLNAIMKAAVDAVIVIDGRGTIRQASDSVEHLFGYTPSRCIGQNVNMLMPEPHRSAHDGYISNYVNSGNAKIIGIGRKTFGQTKDGRVFPMHLSVGQFDYENEHYFIGICHDLSDYVEALEKLTAAEQRYKDIVNSEKHFICRLDGSLRVTFANQSLLKAVGMKPEELRGQTITAIMTDTDLSFSRTIETLFSSADVDEITIKVALRSGDSATLAEWSFRKVETKNNEQLEIQGLGIDISEKEAAISRAEYLNSHDELTGVLKPQAMLSQLRESIAPGKALALFHLDVDRFGQINQRFGYPMGDRVIVQIASRLRARLTKGAWISRLAGDEFLLACPVDDHGDAIIMGRGFAEVFSKPWTFQNEAHLLDCKIGVAMFPHDSDDLSRMPELAEAALKDAKQQGEPIVFFDRPSHESLLRNITIEQALKSALKDGQLEIFLQPKISLQDRLVSSFEALLRWNHPTLGPVSPAEFIPIAESTGLGVHIDRYVLRKVAEIIGKARAAGLHPQPIGVNITAGHFSDSSIFDYLSDLIVEFSLPASAIELEITEGVILSACNRVSSNFKQLRDLGVRISIDDFGTGYSSLSYLKRLDVDELKIDKSFIDDVTSPKGLVVVKAVVDIARTFGLEVTAEGVESEAQADILTKIGCTTGQGYFFSRPAPAQKALFG